MFVGSGNSLFGLFEDQPQFLLIESFKEGARFAQDVTEMAYELKAGLCPIWQCGGTLTHIERISWQEPPKK